MARFIFQQLAAHLGSFLALFHVDPVANFAFGVGGLDEAEPIAIGMMALLRKNFDHIAAGDFVAQRNHLAVHFCAGALMADFGMNGVSKIDGCCAAWQFQHSAFGRKRVNFDGREIDFQRGEKFARLFEFLGPLDQLAHPRDALIFVFGTGLPPLYFQCAATPSSAV